MSPDREQFHDNKDPSVDYGRRYRAGEHIATSFVELAVNQLIYKRMSKSQLMRWSHRGAHLLLQVRDELIDKRLGHAIERCYPGFRRPELDILAA